MTTHDVARIKQSRPPVRARTETCDDAGVRKPLDNPARPKPTYATDDDCAQLLGQTLRQVPRELAGDEQSSFPLLDGLKSLDLLRGTVVARELVFIAAMNHREADERRTAEYLLRNRHDVVDGRRTSESLLFAARYAAEMDVRRSANREVPFHHDAVRSWTSTTAACRLNDPSVGETVVAFLERVIGRQLSPLTGRAVLDAVVVFMELAERHAMNAGTSPALIAMRPAARADARLVTYLRRSFDNLVVARRLARLLIGADGTPIDTAVLWWAACSPEMVVNVPASMRARWSRDLRILDRLLGPARERNAA